jgi:hypothetical protein
MKRTCLVLALALAACSPPGQTNAGKADVPGTTQTVVQVGCNGQTAHDWSAVGSQYYVVEAEAAGATCAAANATLRIKSRDGAVLFERSYPVAQVSLAFNPTDDQTGLREDLEGWVSNTADTPTADWLPSWPAGAAHPPGFTPSVSRGQYESFRGAQGPLFCYPDGGESNGCVGMQGDHATFLGSLTPERS